MAIRAQLQLAGEQPVIDLSEQEGSVRVHRRVVIGRYGDGVVELQAVQPVQTQSSQGSALQSSARQRRAPAARRLRPSVIAVTVASAIWGWPGTA